MPHVHVKFLEHPIERTEEEIAELRSGHLLRESPPVPVAPPRTPVTPLPASIPVSSPPPPAASPK